MDKKFAYLVVGLVLSQVGLILLGVGLIASWASVLTISSGLFILVVNLTLVNRVTGPLLLKAWVTRQLPFVRS